MPAMTPEEMHKVFCDALNSGDLDGLMACYEPGASVIAEPGQVITDSNALRAALGHFVSMKGTMNAKTGTVVTAGDVAFMHADWTFTGTDPKSGDTVNLKGRATEVLRKQSDGRWLYLIDLFDDA